MGSGTSRPTTAEPSATITTTITIRNLTITPLALKMVERLGPSHQIPNGLVKTPSRITGRRPSYESGASSISSSRSHHEQGQPTSAAEEINNLLIVPFSECLTPIDPPDPIGREQIRLTFEDPSTGYRYSGEIPGPSHRSLVLKSTSPVPPDQEEPKIFTAIYLRSHNYLALFSSANLSTWMSHLDPSLPISALSIPGTHNSPTCHVALPSVRCQAVPVATQLTNGVRFLDVRVSCPPFPTTTTTTTTTTKTHHSDPLTLVHSAFPVSLTGPKYLSSLLATIYTFLSSHPSETVLLSLKREGTGRGTDLDLHRHLVTSYLNASSSSPSSSSTHPGEPPRKFWYTSPRIPTLSQCRGKIVLLRRFKLDPKILASSSEEGEARAGGSAPGFGIDASVWPDNVADGTCGSGLVRIQDYYGVGRAEDIALKIRYAQEGLQRAAQRVHFRGPTEKEENEGTAAGPRLRQQPPPPPLLLNFLSASSFFNASCWPDRIAVKVNPSIVEYLCMGHGAPGKGPGQLSIGDAATGIVVTDWVGHHGDWDLIRCIVGWNARLQLGR